jgi:hypothetical protein
MKKPSNRFIATLFCLLICFSACRSTTAPAIPEIPPEGPEASPKQIEPPSELSKSAIPPGASAKPAHPLLPESLISAPEKELASPRLAYDTTISSRPGGSPPAAGWQYRRNRQGQVVGFEFSNHGGNRILPPTRDAAKNQFFTRDFQFRFDERARQDIHFFVTDWVPSRDRQFRLSELMNSVMHFFPRSYLPAIVNFQQRNVVTLPTGEQVEFDPRSGEILTGVLSETPVDFNSDRAARRFPGIDYTGKGILVRANARGADPRMGTTAVITTGTPPRDCTQGMPCSRCEAPSRELWDQTGAMRFKFASDGEFDRFLLGRCGFGLPKFVTETKIAATLP